MLKPQRITSFEEMGTGHNPTQVEMKEMKKSLKKKKKKVHR